MRVSVAVPAHNEAACLDQNVRTLAASCARLFGDGAWTVVVAENGSTDDTAAIAERLVAELPCVRAVTTPHAGKGAAILAAWDAFPADVYAFTDADLSAHPDDLAKLVAALGRADVAIGSRVHPESATVRGWPRAVASTAFNALVRVVLRQPHRDHQCGLKAVRASALATLRPCLSESGFLFDTELIAFARAAGLRVEDVPIRWEEQRTTGRRSTVKFVRSAARMAFGLWRLRRRIRRFLVN